MNCQFCGAAAPLGATACTVCGQLLPAGAYAGASCRTHADRPAAATCSRCGTFYCGECLEPRGSALWCSDCRVKVSGDSVPWDNRHELGVLRAWWKTCLAMMSAPRATVSGVKQDEPFSGSLWFIIISVMAGFFPTLGVYLVALAAFPVAFKDFSSFGSQSAGVMTLTIMLLVGFYTFLIFIWQLVQQLLEHAALRAFGVRAGTVRSSMRIHALSQGPYALGLIPIFGMMVFGIWSLVLRVLLYMEWYKASPVQAIGAVVTPILAVCCVCGGGYGLLAAWVFTTVTR